MITHTHGFLLDENKGSFVNESGQTIDYHKARFYDTDEKNVFKCSVDDSRGMVLPESQVPCKLRFEVSAGEKFCKLTYAGFEPLSSKTLNVK